MLKELQMYKLTKTEKASFDCLEMVEEVFGLFPELDFKTISLMGAQHILPSTLLLLHSLFKRGLDPEKVYLIGKCYSTDISTYEAMKDVGIKVCPSSITFDQDQSFDDFYANAVSAFFENSTRKLRNTETLLLLDDGGELLLKSNAFKNKLSYHLACVEQTTSGYEKLKKCRIDMPIINVARSKPKLEQESKIVAKTAINAIANRMSKGDIRAEKVLIIGNGSIGEAVSDALEGSCDVYCWDINYKKSQIKDRELSADLHRFDLILGCTGVTSLNLDALGKLTDKAVLASLSSSDREFDILSWRQAIPNSITCHSDFIGQNGVKVLNCGFPINFNGVTSEVDIPEFQLTRSLIAGGICQAITQKDSKGIIPLSSKIEQLIAQVYSHKYHQLQPVLVESL